MGAVPRPNIVWRGAHPSNFTYGRGGGLTDGRNSFHHVVGTAESAVTVFNQAGRQASAHFVITDRTDVPVFQCVDMNNTAWSDGNYDSNLKTISMEHHGDWRGGYNNPQVIENSAHLVAWLRDQDIVNRPIRHRDVSTLGTQCPADLPVEQIWNRSSEIINDWNNPTPPTPPEWLANRREVSNYTVYAQIDGLKLFNLNDTSQFADTRVFTKNQNFLIGSETTVGGTSYFITVSSTRSNAAIGMRADQVARTPVTPPDPGPPPDTTSPKWYDAVINDENRDMYVLRSTPLIDLDTGTPFQTKEGKEVWYKAGDIIKDISAHAIVSEVTYQLTEYSYQQVATGKPQNANGIRSGDLTIDPSATPPGTPANPTPLPDPVDPVPPMPDVPPTKFEEKVIQFLRELNQRIIDFLEDWDSDK